MLAHATAHVDLCLTDAAADKAHDDDSPRSPSSVEGGPRLEIRDCRALQPHALRVYGAELAPSSSSSRTGQHQQPAQEQGGAEGEEGGQQPQRGTGSGILRLYGFSKPRCVLECACRCSPLARVCVSSHPFPPHHFCSVNVEPPEQVLEELERRNQLIRAALAGPG